MAQLPNGGLIRGHDKPIHGSCAIYFPGGIRSESQIFIHGSRMTFSLSSGWLPLISSRFFLLLAWLIAPWTHQEMQDVQVFSHSCLPLFTNNMLLDSYVGNLFTPHRWEQLSTLLWMCGAEVLRFGTLSQNPFENEGLDWFELNSDHNLTKSPPKNHTYQG